MPHVTLLTNRATAGEIDPKMEARVDHPAYHEGMRTLENNLPMGLGGWRRMPGSYFDGYTDGSGADKARLIPWVGKTASYWVELTATKARFWQTDFALLGAPTEVVTPWSAAQIWALQWVNIDGVLYFAHEDFRVRVLAEGSPPTLTQLSFTDPNNLVNGADAGSDCPAVCGWSGGRLVLGRTKNRRALIAQSRAPDATTGYRVGDFTTGTFPDDAIVYYVTDGAGSKLRWFARGRRSAAGTEMSTLVDSGAIPTPASFYMDVLDAPNAAAVQPVLVGKSIVYVTGPIPGLQMLYNDESGGVTPVDLTEYWTHMLAPGVVEITAMIQPERIVWAVLSDGTMAACRITTGPGRLSIGWARRIPADGGLVESAAGLRVPTGDVLMMSVNRGGVRHIEHLVITEDTDQEELHYIDSGLRKTYGSPTTTITGLTHLEGKTVHAVGDGGAMPAKVVASGEVTYATGVEKIHIGLPYTSKARPTRPELEINSTWQGKKKRVEEVTLRVYRSLAGKVGQDESSLQPIPELKLGQQLYGSPPALFTGDVELSAIGVIDTDGTVVVVQDDPWPQTVLGIMTRIALVEK